MANNLPFFPTHWYYNTESGQLTQGNNLENAANNIFGGLGWHELNIPGSDTVQQAAAEAVKEFPKGATPTAAGLSPAKIAKTGVGKAAGAATGAAASAAKAALSTLGNITGGITGFSGTNFVLRALKVVVGGVLVIVGFMRMTGAENAITKAVSKVPIIPV